MKETYVSVAIDPLLQDQPAFQDIGSSLVRYYNELYADVRHALLGDSNPNMPLLFEEPFKRGKPAARLYLIYVPEKESSWKNRMTESKIQPWIEEQMDIPLYILLLRNTSSKIALFREVATLPFQNPPLSLAIQRNETTNVFVLEESERNARTMVILLEQLLLA